MTETAKPEIVEALIDNYINVNTKDDDGKTALIHAVRTNATPQVIATLINHGANVNAQDVFGRTALMYAANAKNNPGIITLLISHGANVNIEDKEGKKALDYAKYNNKIDKTDYSLLNEKTNESFFRKVYLYLLQIIDGCKTFWSK